MTLTATSIGTNTLFFCLFSVLVFSTMELVGRLTRFALQLKIVHCGAVLMFLC